MLSQRWRRGFALLAACGVASLAAPPAPARAAAADSIRGSQQWVLSMLNAEAAWQVSRGAGVTVAVIDSGVNPYVSDLDRSVVTGPDFTGVHTSTARRTGACTAPGWRR